MPAAAVMLDDVRYLVNSISGDQKAMVDGNVLKIQSTAKWILQRIEAQALGDTAACPIISVDECTTETIRLATVIFCQSVASLSLISQLVEPYKAYLADLYEMMSRVKLTRWKRTPGIFLFIMLLQMPLQCVINIFAHP